MSIILKGIDLPKDCTECPLEGAEVDDDGFDYWYCKITESMATTIERPSNCPLIQIPKDHGNIIDESKAVVTETIDGYYEITAPTILESED